MQILFKIMQIAKNPPRRRTIAVLLFDGFSAYCLANSVEPLRAANTLAGEPLYRWQFLSVDGSEVASSSGLPVQPGLRLSDHPGGDYLFVMSSYGVRDIARPKTLNALTAAAPRFGALVGFDTGAWLLGAAGLLERRPATIHWDEFTQFAERFPDIDTRTDRYVIDGDRITCGGAITAFELVMDLIAQHNGARLRLDVAGLFMLGEQAGELGGEPGGGPSPLPRITGSQTVDAAVAAMRRAIETPLPIAGIARAVATSQRRLETLFRDRLGLTPAAVYKGVRLREARRLCEQTRFGIAEIATRCGYADASALTRAYKAEFGVPPSAHRKARDSA